MQVALRGFFGQIFPMSGKKIRKTLYKVLSPPHEEAENGLSS